jgi:hypothetical protein
LEDPDFPTNFNDWVASSLANVNAPMDEKIVEAGFDEAYSQYLTAMSLDNVMYKYIDVEGEMIERDFENLRVLIGRIDHFQFVRTAHIDPNGYAKDKRDAIKDWKPADPEMNQAYEYIRQLLNDLDVAINKNGEGKTFGVSYQGKGDKIEVMERFIYSEKREW